MGSPSKFIEQPLGKICHYIGHHRQTLFFSKLIFLKSLGHSPDRGRLQQFLETSGLASYGPGRYRQSFSLIYTTKTVDILEGPGTLIELMMAHEPRVS